MSRSTNQSTRLKLPKFIQRYSGWQGEQCYAQEGRRFIKRQCARANRRFLNQQTQEEILILIKEILYDCA